MLKFLNYTKIKKKAFFKYKNAILFTLHCATKRFSFIERKKATEGAFVLGVVEIEDRVAQVMRNPRFSFRQENPRKSIQVKNVFDIILI